MGRKKFLRVVEEMEKDTEEIEELVEDSEAKLKNYVEQNPEIREMDGFYPSEGQNLIERLELSRELLVEDANKEEKVIEAVKSHLDASRGDQHYRGGDFRSVLEQLSSLRSSMHELEQTMLAVGDFAGRLGDDEMQEWAEAAAEDAEEIKRFAEEANSHATG